MSGKVLLWFGIADPAVVEPVPDAGSGERFVEYDGAVMRLCAGGEVDVIHNPDAATVPLAWCGK